MGTKKTLIGLLSKTEHVPGFDREIPMQLLQMVLEQQI